MVEYMHDIMDLVTNISWRTTSGATRGGFGYEYDAAGRIVLRSHALGDPSHPSQMSQSSQKSYAYDDLDRLTNETVIGVAGTNTIIRHWDSFGRSLGYSLDSTVGRAALCPPSRQSTLSYDPATGRLASMLADGSDTPFVWSYLPGSDLKSSLAYPNGLTASCAYDANGQLLEVQNAFPSNTISQYDYAYDAAGRRIQIARSGSAMSENRTDVFGYNARGELVFSRGAAEGAENDFAYEYDDIGNRITSSEIDAGRDELVSSAYAANNLNQYTSISNSAFSASPSEAFTPQFDDDGNQTLIKTATGIWSVTYNGENRPIIWECVSTNSPTPNSSTPTLISMSYDRMGRRVTKNNQRFVYDGYLQIANFEHQTSNLELQTFVWDPKEPM